MALPQSIVADSEDIERSAWTDLVRMIPEALARDIGLQAGAIHHAYFLLASRIPQFQFNWLSGAGLNGDDGRSIPEAVQRFRQAGQKKFIIQIPPGPNADRCERYAREAGLVSNALAWAKFYRNAEPVPAVHTALTVREIRAHERDLFAATAAAGFGMPPPMAGWLANIVGRPHWHAFVSFNKEAPVGTGALYLRGDYAWLGMGSTLPSLRKQGSQSLLLAHRIAAAGRLGARHVTTETGVPQTGQPAPSYKNILRAGFEVSYVRPNWSEAS